jgi:undecaprenyl-diphosphatase
MSERETSTGVTAAAHPGGDHAGGDGPGGVAVHGLRTELRHDVPRLLLGAVTVYGLLAATGLLLTRVFTTGPLLRADHSVSQWFFEHRTPALDTWTHLVSSSADTLSAIALTAVLVIGLRLWTGRWREPATVLISITGELFIFVLVTATVHRQRPTVPHLDPAPPTSSFPSGHTGASVALYVGLAVILLAVTRGSTHRAGVVALCVLLCAVPVVVGLSRIYRGMHYPSDVVAGALAGGLWTAVVVGTVLRPGEWRAVR